MGNDKEDSGFGFKDRAKAEETLKLLEQHDANYRRLTVRGLLGRAKRVLSMTKAEEKIKNIKEAMEVFESWLAELESNKQKPDKKEREEKRERKEEKKEDKRKSSDKINETERQNRERRFEAMCRVRRQRSQWLRERMAAERTRNEVKATMESTSDEGKDALPSESVSGLGFKDAAAAENSLRVLEGRDPDYQLLAVKGLLGSAKRVLTCTKDQTKLSNIKEAMAILEAFVDEFENKHMSRQNCPYLKEGIVRTANNLAKDTATDQQKGFLAAYASVNGEYKRLRNVAVGDSTWDIVRNVALKELKEKHANVKLFNEKDEPTKEHLEFLLWAYSPEASKVKKIIKETKEDVPAIASLEIDKDKRREDRKRRSSANDESQSKKKRE